MKHDNLRYLTSGIHELQYMEPPRFNEVLAMTSKLPLLYRDLEMHGIRPDDIDSSFHGIPLEVTGDEETPVVNYRLSYITQKGPSGSRQTLGYVDEDAGENKFAILLAKEGDNPWYYMGEKDRNPDTAVDDEDLLVQISTGIPAPQTEDAKEYELIFLGQTTPGPDTFSNYMQLVASEHARHAKKFSRYNAQDFDITDEGEIVEYAISLENKLEGKRSYDNEPVTCLTVSRQVIVDGEECTELWRLSATDDTVRLFSQHAMIDDDGRIKTLSIDDSEKFYQLMKNSLDKLLTDKLNPTK